MVDNFKLIWTPEGGSKREWTFNLANPSWDLTFATEKATDWPWAQFRDRLMNESAIAVQALLWVLRKRDEPRLSMDSVRPSMDELDFQARCPECDQWVDGEDHGCTGSEPGASEPKEAVPGEPRRSSKKSSSTDPGSSTTSG